LPSLCKKENNLIFFFCKRNSLVIKSGLDWVYVYEFMSSQEGSWSFFIFIASGHWDLEGDKWSWRLRELKWRYGDISMKISWGHLIGDIKIFMKIFCWIIKKHYYFFYLKKIKRQWRYNFKILSYLMQCIMMIFFLFIQVISLSS